MNSRDILIVLAIKYQGDWEKIFDCISNKKVPDDKEAEKLLAEFNSGKAKAVTLVDADYPECLKQIYRPPFALFYHGDLDLINKHDKVRIGVFGSRTPDNRCGERVKALFDGTKPEDNCVMVTGLTAGVATEFAKYASNSGIKQVAVLGSGVDYCYPMSNRGLYDAIIKEGGLILSEYPGVTLPAKENFPSRNRIIAGLSDAIIGTNVKQHSGSMIGITLALEVGKEVYIVPRDILDVDKEDDCADISLIADGATPLYDINDVYDIIKNGNGGGDEND